MTWEYSVPTKIVFGEDSLNNLRNITRNHNPRKVMLVTGKSSMEKLGITKRLKDEILTDFDVTVWNKVKSNPTTDLIEDGLNHSLEEGADLVIGLGGGSSLDVAKCVAILNRNYRKETSLVSYIENPDSLIRNNGLPLIAIPTTSGTGSEVTPWATVWDAENERKLSLSHTRMYASHAIIDPVLSHSMSNNLTAATGLDALSQGIESYWSRNHNPISDVFAEKAIRLAYGNLKMLSSDWGDTESRKMMSMASLFSGLAINGTKTTAPHSLSYPMTLRFNVPHGHACALTIPSFMAFNSKAVPERIKTISGFLGAASTEDASEMITRLVEELGLPAKLGKLGIGEEGIEHIIKKGFTPDRAKNNPREVTESDARDILRGIL